MTQLLGVVFVFVYMPILLSKLGKTEYGIWLTLTAVASWLVQFDIGYSNGLRNKLTKLVAKSKQKLAREYIGSSLYYFSLYTFIAMLLLLFASSAIKISDLLNFDSASNNYLDIAIFIIVFSSMIHLLLGITNSIAYSIHLSFIPPLRNMLFHGVILLGAIFIDSDGFNDVKHEGVYYLSLIYLSSVLISNLSTSLFLYYKYKEVRPDFRKIDHGKFSETMKTGSGFFLLQITAVILFTSDSVMISVLLGSEYVPEYSLSNKLFLFIIMMQGFFMAPLWSLYTKMYAENEIKKIFIVLNKTLRISIGVCLLILPLTFFGEYILNSWVRSDELYNKSLFIALSALTMLRVFSSNFSTLFNGLGVLRFQIAHSVLAVILNIFCTVFFVKHMGFGTEGVAMGTVLAMIPYLLFSPLYIRKKMCLDNLG